MRRSVPLLALAALVIVVAPARAAAPAAGQVDDLVANGKFEEAVNVGRAAVLAAPADPDLRFALAKALAAHARRLERVVEVKGKPSDLASGSVRLKASDFQDGTLSVGYDAALYEEALLNLSEAIKRAPKRQDVRMLQCYLLTDGARIDRADKAIRDALANLPRTPALADDLVKFGTERTKRGDPEGGARLIRIVADAFPSDPEVQIDLGLSLARLGRRPEAVQALDRGASLAPKDASLQRKRAAASMILRDYPRAIAAYENAFEASQSDEDRFGKAAATWGTDVAKAQPLFEDLATPSPSAHPGLVDAARAWADAAAEGRSSPAAMTLAERLVEEGQLILAIPLLDGVLAGDPGNAKARTMLVDVFTRLESPRLAKEVASKPKAPTPAKAK